MKHPLIQALQDECLHTPENVLFLLGIQYKHLHPDLEEFLENFGDSEILARKFLEYTENGWRLKISLNQELGKKFKKFISELTKVHVGTKGHLNNELKYSIGRGSQESRQAYSNLLISIPDLDNARLARKIASYYESSKYPTKLSKYLTDEAFFDYQEEEYE